MKDKIKGFIVGVLVMTVLISTTLPALAKVGSEALNAAYMNIKLVIDGVLIEPKDANGNAVEPFIYNGTTFLPVRAVGEAFNKEVRWDGNTATVYVGEVVEKPAMELPLYSRSYISNSSPSKFKSYEEKGINYIGYRLHATDGEEGSKLSFGSSDVRYNVTESVTYPLNGLAKSIKGTLLPSEEKGGSPEVVYKIYNESDKLLYQSPIMIQSTTPVDFEVDLTNCLSVRIEVTMDTGWGYYHTLLLKNLTIISTDY